jgi:hypothetical protein
MVVETRRARTMVRETERSHMEIPIIIRTVPEKPPLLLSHTDICEYQKGGRELRWRAVRKIYAEGEEGDVRQEEKGRRRKTALWATREKINADPG